MNNKQVVGEINFNACTQWSFVAAYGLVEKEKEEKLI